MQNENKIDDYVEIEIDDDLLLALAKEAHKQDITLNELINKLLTKSMRREIDEQQQLCDQLTRCVRAMIAKGISKESLLMFANAYVKWTHEYHGEQTSGDLITKGFES